MAQDDKRATVVEQETLEGGRSLDISDLIVWHHASLYRYAYRLSGSEADAEDLTQQTFLIAQQKLHQVRETEKVAGWLYAVLRSCFLKSKRGKKEIDAGSLDFNMEYVPQREEVNEEQIDPKVLQDALNELPEHARIVLLMFYFEKLSYKEIAEELEIAIGTVMSRLARAKSRLRQLLISSSDHDDRTSQVDGLPSLMRTSG